jgi:sugar phosphate isomerase/epimerase
MQTRRQFLQSVAGTTAAALSLPLQGAVSPSVLKLKYMLSSALYGDMTVEDILPQVASAGCEGLDIWCKPHGTQREQLEVMGLAAFEALAKQKGVHTACFTCYPLGPFDLQKEMPNLKRLGGKLLITGAKGPKDVTGPEAKVAIAAFLEQMKPHADAAAENGLVIAIENHSSSLLQTPDSIRYWGELNKHPALGVAFAPHHLREHIEEIPKLLSELGASNLPFIYFQEHGIGSQKKVEKEIELQQLPGRGTLDYKPILTALRSIGFGGWVEIFMHPTPRGVPILPTPSEVTAAINQSRAHIEKLLLEVNT